MIKLSTMQKLFGLSLILSLFTVAVGVYSVSNLSKLSDGIDVLYKNHVKGLDAARALNIEALRLIRGEKNVILTNEADEIQRYLDELAKTLRWVVNFVRHAMRPSELINPVAFVQMLPGRCTPVQLAAAACCKKFLYIQ